MTRVSLTTGTPIQSDRSSNQQAQYDPAMCRVFRGDEGDTLVTRSPKRVSPLKALCSKGFRGLVTRMTGFSDIPTYRAHARTRAPAVMGFTCHPCHQRPRKSAESLIWRGFAGGDGLSPDGAHTACVRVPMCCAAHAAARGRCADRHFVAQKQRVLPRRG